MSSPATIRACVALLLLLGVYAPSVAGFDAIDANHNGTISEEEAQAAGRAVFKSLDRNGDGTLSNDEVQTRLAPQVLKAADPDADSGLNAEEYAALVTARFKSSNSDAEGTVDRSELSTLAGKLLRDLIDGEVQPVQPIPNPKP
jgi:Ca2+-binding EF-hand superfamily protein